MGARLALRTAALFPDTVVAAGGFHGGGLVTGDADSPHRLAAETPAPSSCSGMPTGTARCRRRQWRHWARR